MSAVIKAVAGDTGVLVQAFCTAAPGVDAVAHAADPVVERLLEAEARVASLETVMRETRVAHDAAIVAAREDGRKDGLAAADTRGAARIAALERGVTAAVEMLATRFETLDGLAAMLARRALDKVLAPTLEQSALVSAMVKRQLVAVRAQTVLAVRVSAHDFGADQALGDFAASVCPTIRDVAIDPDLESGCCRFDLALGQFDLDLADQRRQLVALLDALAEAGDAAR